MESSITPWVSPVVLVRKADKTSRLYIDYRNLYKTTIKGSYPLPHNRDILDMLHRNYLFMALDLLKALHQITRLILKKLVVKKQLLPHMLGSSNTCFLFGLTNAPPSFQCLQEHVLWDCIDKFNFFYINDTVIFSNTFEDHLSHMASFVDLKSSSSQGANQQIQFAKISVKFLAHLVTPSGVGSNKKNIEAVTSFPIPTKVKDIHAFLGFPVVSF